MQGLSPGALSPLLHQEKPCPCPSSPATTRWHGLVHRRSAGPCRASGQRGKPLRFYPQYTGLEALYRQFGPKASRSWAFPAISSAIRSRAMPRRSPASARSTTLSASPDGQVRGSTAPGPTPLSLAQGAKPGLLGSEAIKWNFTKFLIDREGRVMDRFAPRPGRRIWCRPSRDCSDGVRRGQGPLLAPLAFPRRDGRGNPARDTAAARAPRICYITRPLSLVRSLCRAQAQPRWRPTLFSMS